MLRVSARAARAFGSWCRGFATDVAVETSSGHDVGSFSLPNHVHVRCHEGELPDAREMWRTYVFPEQPVVFRDAVGHWPAIRGAGPDRPKWADWTKLGERFADRLVSVEQGAVFYGKDAVAGVRVPFGLYLTYMHASDDERRQLHAELPHMYLGQTDIFQDIPELEDDIEIPAFACASPAGRGVSHATINAWFGRAGQISPLHFDPQNNLLTQVVGHKLVLLYPPGTNMPRSTPQEAGSHAQSNISDIIDPRDASDSIGAGIRAAETAQAVVLSAGDALFIPRRWWHFCAAVDSPELADAALPGRRVASIGLNFWSPHPVLKR